MIYESPFSRDFSICFRYAFKIFGEQTAPFYVPPQPIYCADKLPSFRAFFPCKSPELVFGRNFEPQLYLFPCATELALPSTLIYGINAFHKLIGNRLACLG